MGGIKGADGGTSTVQYDNAIDNADQVGGLHVPHHPVNKVVTQGGENTTSQPGGTEETRQATKTVEQEVAEAMAADPEAKRLQGQLDAGEALAKDWNYVQDNLIGSGDGVLDRDAIIAASKDSLQTPEVQAAAKRLLANPEFLNGVNKDDSKASVQDVYAYLDGLRSKIEGIRATKTSEVKEARGIATNQQQAAGGGGTNGAPPGSNPADSIPKPPPSTLPGMEGAMENLGNSADYYSKQMLAIANDTTMDPGKKTALISDLQQKQQATMNMLNQLIQMMSNTSKLWSDIAMNSVRNIK